MGEPHLMYKYVHLAQRYHHERMSGRGVLGGNFLGMGRFREGGGRGLRIEVGRGKGWEGGQPSL